MSDGDVVLRVARDKKYKTIKTDVLEDEDRVSWRAAGIHSYLISRPDGWQFNRADLVNRHTEGREAVKTALGELREAGYLRMRRRRRSDGTFGRYEWIVSEVPLTASQWAEVEGDSPQLELAHGGS